MIPETLKEHPVVQALLREFEGAVLAAKDSLGEVTLEIEPSRIVDVCRYLKHQEQFNRLCSVTAVDWYPTEPRFEVVYHLQSIPRNLRLRLKCRVSGENPEIDSVTGVWRSANWYEREVYDLFGISFRGHPDLRRIMMPENWIGHPLRKDYPVHGYRYSYAEEE